MIKVDSVNFGNKIKIPANHEEMENKALIEIYKRVMTGENGSYRIDFYQGSKNYKYWR